MKSLTGTPFARAKSVLPVPCFGVEFGFFNLICSSWAETASTNQLYESPQTRIQLFAGAQNAPPTPDPRVIQHGNERRACSFTPPSFFLGSAARTAVETIAQVLTWPLALPLYSKIVQRTCNLPRPNIRRQLYQRGNGLTIQQGGRHGDPGTTLTSERLHAHDTEA